MMPEKRSLGSPKRANCRLTMEQVLQLPVILPFLQVRRVSQFQAEWDRLETPCRKDVLYDFLNDDRIDWRGILQDIAIGYMGEMDGLLPGSASPRFPIVDDTDLPKTGTHMEGLGMVYPHNKHRRILAKYGLINKIVKREQTWYQRLKRPS